MKTEEAALSTWEDLVFENRNKAYGAFAIRKSYSRNVGEALLGSVLLTMVVLMSPRVLSWMEVDQTVFVSKKEINETITIRLRPIIESNKKIVQKQPLTRVKENSNFQVTTLAVPDERVQERPPDVETGTVQQEGQPMSFQGQDPTSGVENPAVVGPSAPLDYAEGMPASKGGLQAMMKFIQKNLKYPTRAKRIGIEGKVFIKFIVNDEGKVVNVEVSRGIYDDCDKEVVRVISMMPAWNPGRQNNMPVSVRMILPINFKLEN